MLAEQNTSELQAASEPCELHLIYSQHDKNEQKLPSAHQPHPRPSSSDPYTPPTSRVTCTLTHLACPLHVQ